MIQADMHLLLRISPTPSARDVLDSVIAWLNSSSQICSVHQVNESIINAELSCGLKIRFEFSPSKVDVYSNDANPQHLVRHIEKLSASVRFELVEETGTSCEVESRNYQVWRQGDDGNAMRVGLPTSRLDADCWQAELESHKHKQIYWVASVHPKATRPTSPSL